MSDMTQSFIEMVEAFKAKPELEATIKRLTEDKEFFERNLRIEEDTSRQLRDSIAALNARLSEVTKERDDASFRNLELDEKLSGIEKLLGLAERLEQARKEEHQATVDALTPKPEPVPVPLSSTESSGVGGIPNDHLGPIDPVVVEGQSAADPTPTTIPSTQQDVGGAIEPALDSRPINPYSGFPVHYPDGEYKGQPYYDKPSWVSWAAWVDAGGEAEPYMKNFG